MTIHPKLIGSFPLIVIISEPLSFVLFKLGLVCQDLYLTLSACHILFYTKGEKSKHYLIENTQGEVSNKLAE